MQRDEAVTIVARRLGNRTDLNSAIIAEMQLAQSTFEHHWPSDTYPWFLLTESASTSTNTDDERVQLPSDFIQEVEEAALWIQQDDGSYLEMCKYDLDTLRRAEPASGRPRKYAVLGQYIHFWPVPDSTYAIKMIYVAEDTVLDSNVENKWLKYAPELLIAATGLRMAAYVQNKIVMDLFLQQQGELIRTLVHDSLDRSLTNRRLYYR